VGSLASAAFVTGAEWALALGLFAAIASWGFGIFIDLFSRGAR